MRVEREQITPNYYVLIGNHGKTHDNNEECENENRHDELYDDDLEDEEEEVYHCYVKN